MPPKKATTSTTKGSSTTSTNKPSSTTTATTNKTTTTSTTTTSTTTVNQTLPTKYDTIFKNLIKNYENKAYDKALKQAEQILTECPNHGDSLAMKAILIRYLKEQELNKQVAFNTDFYYNAKTLTEEEKEYKLNTELMMYDRNYKKECYQLVKKALELTNNKSFICWHVYGLLYKEDLKYKESITCFLNSLKFNPPNELQIIRELTTMQIHIRDLKNLISSRKKLMELKPGIGAFWIGFAIAQHLNLNYQIAIDTIDKYINLLFDSNTKGSKTYKYELSELLLYLNNLFFEFGKYKECIEQLLTKKDLILDDLFYLERLGDCYMKLNQLENAKKVYFELLKKNKENLQYIEKYFSSNNILNIHDLNNKDLILNLFESDENLKELLNNSTQLKILRLKFTNDKELFITFIEPYLNKTIPSLFQTLKGIYRFDENKIKMIENIFLEKLNELENNKEDPTIVLWVYIYLSQHYLYLKNYKLSLQYINKAIEHTPTLIENYMILAKIYKNLNLNHLASENMELARHMDLSDRYLNTKSTKYLLRDNNIIKANEVIGIFAKHPIYKDEEPSEQKHYHNTNIHYMQGMWFENECGDSHFRKLEFNLAIRHYYFVIQHFNEIKEDQYDFHTYSLRKNVIRNYIEMLRYMDQLFNHYYFLHACLGLCNVYLHLLRKQEHENPVVYNLNANITSQSYPLDIRIDEDLNGIYLTKHVNIFDECTRYLKYLEDYHSNNINTYIYSTIIYLKSNKYLFVSKSLKKALELDNNDYRVHFLLFKYLITIKQVMNNEQDKESSLFKLLNLDFTKITNNKSLNEMNLEYYKRNENNILSVLSVHCVDFMIKKAQLSDNNNNNAFKSILDCKSDCIEDYDIVYYSLWNGYVHNDMKYMTNRPYKQYKYTPYLDFVMFDNVKDQLEFADKVFNKINEFKEINQQ
ncbi:hypothetical protein ABK040_014467 [Willaertia magna]